MKMVDGLPCGCEYPNTNMGCVSQWVDEMNIKNIHLLPRLANTMSDHNTLKHFCNSEIAKNLC